MGNMAAILLVEGQLASYDEGSPQVVALVQPTGSSLIATNGEQPLL